MNILVRNKHVIFLYTPSQHFSCIAISLLDTVSQNMDSTDFFQYFSPPVANLYSFKGILDMKIGYFLLL